MRKDFRGFFRYYRQFGVEFLSQLWSSFRAEVWPAVVLALLVFLVSYRRDTNAKTAFLYTAEACAIYILVWAMYHLIRTPWKLSLTGNERVSSLSFKAEALAVSTSILDFYYERSQSEPTLSAGDYSSGSQLLQSLRQSQAEHAARDAYRSETLGIYAYKFSRKVMEMVSILKRMGLADEVTLSAVGENPENVEAVKIIGEHLAELGERIVER
ncbi:MAG: hypothetical protein ABI147_11300 [Acidobacteriaceae bacterium]